MYLEIFCVVFTLSSIEAVPRASFTSMICPPGVSKFAAEPNSRNYYVCEKVGAHPVLKQCPIDTLYHASDMKCKSTKHHRNRRDVEIIEELTLGRQVALGDLYNARTNRIWTGTSFWDRATIDQHKYRNRVPNTKTTFFSAATAYQRMSFMDIKASLQLGFMSGLINVEGSAQYLRDESESDDMVNMNMAYYATTHTDVLSSAAPKDHIKYCQNDQVTHVVSSITYGMGANFVFKKHLKTGDNKEIIFGKLSVSVKSIPGVTIEGSASLNITSEQKDFNNEIEVTLYGDFILDEQPTTYEQALEVFKIIPTKMGAKPDYQMAAPVKMTLVPRSIYCDTGDNILIGISSQLLDSVSKVLDKSDQLKIKISGLLLKDPSKRFLPVRRNLQAVLVALTAKVGEMQAELQALLPKIRGGGKGSQEGNLVQLLGGYNSHPTEYDKCTSFLMKRSREMTAIDMVLQQFKNSKVTIVDYEHATGVIKILTAPQVVIFNMNILQPHSITTDYLEGKAVDESGMWFNKPDIVGLMGLRLREFREFANENGGDEFSYLVKINPVTEGAGKTLAVNAMVNGASISEDFRVPVPPSQPEITAKTHHSVTIKMPSRTTSDGYKNNFINAVKVIVTNILYGSKHERVFEYAGNDGFVIISGLSSATAYRFAMKFVTVVGQSPAGKSSEPVTTLPSSPPASYNLEKLERSSVTVAWQAPVSKGEGVVIGRYSVELFRNGALLKRTSTTSKKISFSNLKVATGYSLCIKAVVTDEHTSQCLTVPFTTLPSPPPTPSVSSVTKTSASVSWSAVTPASGASIVHYLVNFVQYDSTGANIVTGSAQEKKSTGTSVSLADLVVGTTYAVKIKVVTTKGTSAYSNAKMFKTLYQVTELGKLKTDISNKMRSEYQAAFKTSSSSTISKANSDDAKAQNTLTDLTNKYNGLNNGGWPAGHYCIYKGNDKCPDGFTQRDGHMKGIATKLDAGWNGWKNYIQGSGFGQSSVGCYNRFCGFYKPWNAEIILKTCCK